MSLSHDQKMQLRSLSRPVLSSDRSFIWGDPLESTSRSETLRLQSSCDKKVIGSAKVLAIVDLRSKVR